MKRIKNTFTKLLFLFPVLFIAGCGRADYVSIGLGLDQESIPNVFYGFVSSIKMGIDKLIASFFLFFKGVASFDAIQDYVSNSSTYFTDISKVVGWFQSLALAYIAIRFGWMILNEYIIQQDNRMATPLIQQFKKLFIALLMVFLLPTITFSAYAGSSYLGVLAAKEWGANNMKELEAYEIFNKMDKLGISYSTYCRVEIDGKFVKVPKSNASGDVNVMVENLSDDELLKKNIASHAKGTEYEENYEQVYKDIWDNTCGQGEYYRVGTGLSANKELSKMMFTTGGNAFAILARTIITLVFWLVCGYMVIKRTLDIVFLTLMGWFYCGESISSAPNNQAFATFGRKLLSICMTQFFVITELGIFSFFSANSPDVNVFFDIAVNLAWLSFLMGTPTFISEICHDTGAAGDAAWGGKALKKSWDAFRGK